MGDEQIMKILIIPLLLIIMLLTGCAQSVTPDQVASLEAGIKSLKVADNDALGKINDINKSLQKYATSESMIGIDTRLNEYKAKADAFEEQTVEIKRLQAQVLDLQNQIVILRQDFVNNKIVSTETDTTNPENVLTVTVSKSVDSVSEILEGSENKVNFTVKMTNKTDLILDNIIIKGYIECNNSLGLYDGYPIMKDTTNSSLIYDYAFDGNDIIDFEFRRSTGSPTVYLNPLETFIFHPELILRGDDDYDNTFRFTLVVESFTVGVE
jgi:hypothetical protein